MEREKKEKVREQINTLMDEFKSKFDENGVCKTTNLPYDEFYFRVDGVNIVTGRKSDVRGFDCTGRCVTNKFEIYDKNGFKQDGTHYKTGKKYHIGYNAYCVDENGKTIRGYLHQDIQIAKGYVEALFKPTKTMNGVTYIKTYAKSKSVTVETAKKELRVKVFTAGEMYPEFKEEIEKIVEETKMSIREKTMALVMLKRKSKDNQEVIRKYEEYIKRLKDKIDAISIGMGER